MKLKQLLIGLAVSQSFLAKAESVETVVICLDTPFSSIEESNTSLTLHQIGGYQVLELKEHKNDNNFKVIDAIDYVKIENNFLGFTQESDRSVLLDIKYTTRTKVIDVYVGSQKYLFTEGAKGILKYDLNYLEKEQKEIEIYCNRTN